MEKVKNRVKVTDKGSKERRGEKERELKDPKDEPDHRGTGTLLQSLQHDIIMVKLEKYNVDPTLINIHQHVG